MTESGVSSFSQFLNYGGLGLLAILCLVVLGYNVWSLNGLIAKAEPERINAARPLLLGQMGVSLVGLLAVGAGGIYLDRLKVEDSKTRVAQIILDPWDEEIDKDSRPIVSVPGGLGVTRPIRVVCTPGEPAIVTVNFDRYIRYRIENSIKSQRALLPISASSGER
jgi:hypothetical protein